MLQNLVLADHFFKAQHIDHTSILLLLMLIIILPSIVISSANIQYRGSQFQDDKMQYIFSHYKLMQRQK